MIRKWKVFENKQEATTILVKLIYDLIKFFYLTHYLDGVDVNTGIFEADAVRNILDLYMLSLF